MRYIHLHFALYYLCKALAEISVLIDLKSEDQIIPSGYPPQSLQKRNWIRNRDRSFWHVQVTCGTRFLLYSSCSLPV